MQRVIQIVIALSFVSYTLAAFADVRITEGGNSGRLEFQDSDGNWGTVCRDGFDDDAGDVACDQLGYLGASDVSTYGSAPVIVQRPNLCQVTCAGYESALIYCSYISYGTCTCSEIVSITCTNGLTAGQVAGIVIGVLVFIGLVTTCVILCICCIVPTCPCYYRSYRHTRTVVLTQRAPEVVTTTATSTKTTNYQPPPVHNPDSGYQPYPAAAPPTTTVNY